jgi:hypothetical protein
VERPLKLTAPTQGDWKYETEGCSVCNDRIVIADVLPGPHQDSDGLLLAAAPELLAACEGILPFVAEDFSDETPDGESCASDEYREAFRKIVEAVKKAKGA